MNASLLYFEASTLNGLRFSLRARDIRNASLKAKSLAQEQGYYGLQINLKEIKPLEQAQKARGF